MKDLFEQIQSNDLSTLSRRRKEKKGSRLARNALREALGGDDNDNGYNNTKQGGGQWNGDEFCFEGPYIKYGR